MCIYEHDAFDETQSQERVLLEGRSFHTVMNKYGKYLHLKHVQGFKYMIIIIKNN